MTILDFSTFCAHHLTALLATKDTLKKIFAASWLQSSLKSVEQKVEKLLCILLFGNVSGTAIKLLECEAEAERVEVVSLR